MERKVYTIDAAGKPLGRLASQIAILLRGKDKPTFVPNKDEGNVVIVKNIKKIDLTGKKKDKKLYYRHSGRPGKLKVIPFKKIFEENPEEVLRKAVLGMLPKTKLRKSQIKRLKFQD